MHGLKNTLGRMHEIYTCIAHLNARCLNKLCGLIMFLKKMLSLYNHNFLELSTDVNYID